MKKRKNKKKKIDNRVLAFDDYKAGELVWYKYHDNSIKQGEINQFIPTNTEGCAVIIQERESLTYRTVLLSNISKTRILKIRNKK